MSDAIEPLSEVLESLRRDAQEEHFRQSVLNRLNHIERRVVEVSARIDLLPTSNQMVKEFKSSQQFLVALLIAVFVMLASVVHTNWKF